MKILVPIFIVFAFASSVHAQADIKTGWFHPGGGPG
jgi:hypothetical protein